MSGDTEPHYGAQEDAIVRFLLDGEYERCPQCSSPRIEAEHLCVGQRATCPDCNLTLEWA